jgi:hypothetical protein
MGSLLPTDEDKARYKGFSDGKDAGWDNALSDLEIWMENDSGMISVESIRKRIRDMRIQGPQQ